MRSDSSNIDSRTAALDLLNQVLGKGRSLQVALTDPALQALPQRDRAFARRMTATTLRRLGQLDTILDTLLERPLAPKLHSLRNILRLGLAQLLFDDVPAYAAVDTTVALTRTLKLNRYIKLANAIMRRAQREASTLRQTPAVPTNTPGWLWNRWVAHYGPENAAAIAQQHLAIPPLDLTVPQDAAAWAERLGGSLLPTGSLRLTDAGRIDELPGYDEGAWWVQDGAAAIPARLLQAGAGTPVLDLCAAPGGKTAQLAATGAAVTAVDRGDKRLATLQSNLQRLGLTADCIPADAVTYQPPDKQSHILLDAPCTATGTLRRNPDIAWTRTEDDLQRAAAAQTKLLHAAAKLLGPGGTLVYAVCSLEPEEGEQQVENLLSIEPDLQRGPIDARETGGLDECITAAGDLRTLPCHLAELGGLDGFFAARLRRR